jgi:hypothetical protein
MKERGKIDGLPYKNVRPESETLAWRGDVPCFEKSHTAFSFIRLRQNRLEREEMRDRREKKNKLERERINQREEMGDL